MSDVPPSPSPLIEAAHVYNFRSLREASVRFSPLTLLVGPNASGKSALLDALLLGRPASTRDRWQDDTSLGCGVLFESEGMYRVAHTNISLRRLEAVDDVLRSLNANPLLPSPSPEPWTIQPLCLEPNALRTPNTPREAVRLSKTGDNLTNVIASLSRPQQTALSEALAEHIPSLRDMDVRPIDGGKLQLRFYDRWNPQMTYSPDQVSDGTMMMVAFLVLQYQAEPPHMITIEEPERGLHPSLMSELVSMLRKLAERELGPRRVQVVLATHSAELLDSAHPEEVRFFARDPKEGDTRIHAINPGAENWEEDFALYKNSLGEAITRLKRGETEAD